MYLIAESRSLGEGAKERLIANYCIEVLPVLEIIGALVNRSVLQVSKFLHKPVMTDSVLLQAELPPPSP